MNLYLEIIIIYDKYAVVYGINSAVKYYFHYRTHINIITIFDVALSHHKRRVHKSIDPRDYTES